MVFGCRGRNIISAPFGKRRQSKVTIRFYKKQLLGLIVTLQGKTTYFRVKTGTNGSKFRQTVWQALCEIPYGELTTYGELSQKIAARLGKQQMSAQAVGGAVGHNAISIIIPCHRVVGATGSLTGYAGGIDKKLQLLKHEGVNMDRLFVPAKSTAP